MNYTNKPIESLRRVLHSWIPLSFCIIGVGVSQILSGELFKWQNGVFPIIIFLSLPVYLLFANKNTKEYLQPSKPSKSTPIKYTSLEKDINNCKQASFFSLILCLLLNTFLYVKFPPLYKNVSQMAFGGLLILQTVLACVGQALFSAYKDNAWDKKGASQALQKQIDSLWNVFFAILCYFCWRLMFTSVGYPSVMEVLKMPGSLNTLSFTLAAVAFTSGLALTLKRWSSNTPQKTSLDLCALMCLTLGTGALVFWAYPYAHSIIYKNEASGIIQIPMFIGLTIVGVGLVLSFSESGYKMTLGSALVRAGMYVWGLCGAAISAELAANHLNQPFLLLIFGVIAGLTTREYLYREKVTKKA